MRIPKPSPHIERSLGRNTKHIDHETLSNDLAAIDTSQLSPDGMVEQYNSQISAIFDSHAPLVERKITVRPNTAWYNSTIRHAKVIKRRLERKAKKVER